MYDSENYSDWHHSLQELASVAGASEIKLAPGRGEVYRVLMVNGLHDDPAAHNVYWLLEQGASRTYTDNGTGGLAANVQSYFYSARIAAPIQLREGEAIVFLSDAPMAAGKKLYLHVWTEVLVGVTA